MKKESLDDELKGLSPWLRDLGMQEEGFRVPEGYFGALEESVYSRVESAENRRKPVMRIKRGGFVGRFSRSQVLWAAAASLALLLAATWLIRVKPAREIVATQELTEEEIEAYVLENIRDFDVELLADVPAVEQTLPETQPAAPREAKPKQPDPMDDLSEEELELLLKEMSDEELENLLKT